MGFYPWLKPIYIFHNFTKLEKLLFLISYTRLLCKEVQTEWLYIFMYILFFSLL